MEANKHFILYITSKVGKLLAFFAPTMGLLLYSKKNLCENNARRYVISLLDGDLGMTPKLLCPSNKSSYFW